MFVWPRQTEVSKEQGRDHITARSLARMDKAGWVFQKERGTHFQRKEQEITKNFLYGAEDILCNLVCSEIRSTSFVLRGRTGVLSILGSN